MADAVPVMKGTLDVLVLKALSWGPMHGYEVTRWLEERSGGTLGIEDSALYQAFYRLEERGFLSAEWGQTENNRKARYYRITSSGRAHLRAQAAQWAKYADAVSGILATPARG